MVSHLQKMKLKYPDAHVVLWASLECTNFSRAKGGQPRDADSRTLAEHLFRYIEAINPDYIQIENVEEFMCWGALDENGKPVSRDRGRDYLRWVNHVQRYGYDFDWRILNAADFGAYTSRKRYFGQFAKRGLPIAFPTQTHAKSGDDGGMFRIYAGLVKFVAGSKRRHEAWILKYNSMNQKGSYTPPSIEEPCPTVACQNRLGVVKCNFLSKQFSGRPDDKNISVKGPAGAITTRDHHAFITAYYGGAEHNYSMEAPSATVTTKDRLSIVKLQFIDNQYGNGSPSGVGNPAPAVLANPKQRLVSAEQYSTETGDVVGIAIYEDDSPMMVKIKEFMAMYNIVDIKMRMLKIVELKKIMGFSPDYTLIGTQAEQKKFIGNAVEVNMSRVLCEALCEKLEKIAA